MISVPDSLIGRLLPSTVPRTELTEEEERNRDVVVNLRFARIADRPSFHQPGAERPNRTGLAALDSRAIQSGTSGTLNEGLTDRHDEFIDIIAKGDRVWTVFTVTGTHTGVLWGHEPTGRTLSFLEIGLYRLTDGKIAESWYLGDELSVLTQLENGVSRASE